MSAARQRTVVVGLALLAASVLGWGAWRWELWAQRRAIARLHAAEPADREAAAT